MRRPVRRRAGIRLTAIEKVSSGRKTRSVYEKSDRSLKGEVVHDISGNEVDKLMVFKRFVLAEDTILAEIPRVIERLVFTRVVYSIHILYEEKEILLIAIVKPFDYLKRISHLKIIVLQ